MGILENVFPECFWAFFPPSFSNIPEEYGDERVVPPSFKVLARKMCEKAHASDAQLRREELKITKYLLGVNVSRLVGTLQP